MKSFNRIIKNNFFKATFVFFLVYSVCAQGSTIQDCCNETRMFSAAKQQAADVQSEPGSHLSKVAAVIKVDPLEFVDASRFDIIAKYIYAKHRDLAVNCDWYKKMYKSIVKACYAYQNELSGKQDVFSDAKFEEIKNRFHKIIDAVKSTSTDTFDNLVAFNSESKWIDGDVVAACILYNKKIPVKTKSKLGGTITSKLLKKYMENDDKNSRQWDLDAIAIKFCELKQNARVAIVLPEGVDKVEAVKKTLKKYGDIVYTKQVSLKKNGPFNLMKMLGKDVFGDDETKAQALAGYHFKEEKSKDGNHLIKAFLIEYHGPNAMKKCRDEVDKMLGLSGLNSFVQITQTKDLAITMVQTLLNDNSVYWLNYSVDKKFENLNRHLRRINELIKKYNLDSECFIVVWSSCLASFGIRENVDSDLDTHPSYKEILSNDLADIRYRFCCKGRNAFSKRRDFISYNPKCFFYNNKIKLISMFALIRLYVRFWSVPESVATLISKSYVPAFCNKAKRDIDLIKDNKNEVFLTLIRSEESLLSNVCVLKEKDLF
jgi:hypothetical protein